MKDCHHFVVEAGVVDAQVGEIFRAFVTGWYFHSLSLESFPAPGDLPLYFIWGIDGVIFEQADALAD